MSSSGQFDPQVNLSPPTSVGSHPVHDEVKRLRSEEKIRRELNHSFGNYFLWSLIGILILTVGSYLILHKNYPPKNTIWKPEELAQFDSAGRLTHLSPADIRWYLGNEDAAALISSLQDRSQQIDTLENKVVRQSLMEFEVRFGSAGDSTPEATAQINSFEAAARNGDFSNSAAILTGIVEHWPDDTRKFVGENSIFDLDYGLGELARLKQQQLGALSTILRPPLTSQIFWMSPQWAMLEAIYWSLFGTIVNLLVNISQARARGRYTRDEFWVSLSKLIYGPILSFVLILAIYFGMINPGTEVRFWFLPLAGFLFGYNTRKTAVLIDKLSAKLLGSASDSVDQMASLKSQSAANAAEAIRAKATPKTFSELKQQALIIADTTTTAAVLNQQSQK